MPGAKWNQLEEAIIDWYGILTEVYSRAEKARKQALITA